jgi:xylulose-5-phosphate/fructose-6-phosphate phosphoketolase
MMAMLTWIHPDRVFADKLIEHRRYINEHGVDMPEIRAWKWGTPK